ncbi:hypothetical protein APTSU1_000912000 [Apodemus speciosus]|uniref:Uncharacterized protein n=1 Tax=Apodemus speciosus TaxID=105296 RepID=A0ABQ0F3X2_APOSI
MAKNLEVVDDGGFKPRTDKKGVFPDDLGGQQRNQIP